MTALALDEMVSEKAPNLIQHPALGRPGRVQGTRELVVHPNDILIADDGVRMLRVLHARRQWPTAFDGDPS